MYRRPRNRVARDFAERFITRRLVRQLMIAYEYVSGLPTRSGSWNLLGAQDLLPMEVCGQGSALGAEIDYDPVPCHRLHIGGLLSWGPDGTARSTCRNLWRHARR